MSTELIEKVQRFRQDALKCKSEEQYKSLWTEADDQLITKLERIARLASTSYQMALDMFKATPLVGCQDWVEHWSKTRGAQGLEVMRATNRGQKRVRNVRTTSKITNCRKCGSPTEIHGNKIICTNKDCEESYTIQSKTGKPKANVMKHTRNKIEGLIGHKDPPGIVVQTMPQITVWLTNLRYLSDWLVYKESFTMLKVPFDSKAWWSELMDIYSKRGLMIVDGKPPMDIPIEKAYAWTYAEYKLIITEFHAMMRECSRRSESRYVTTNMLSLADDVVYDIMKAYHDEYHEVPGIASTYEYEGIVYDVGNFINVIALSNEDTEIKRRLDALFETNIKVPGLMFNYFAASLKKEPECYALTESYSYIKHKVFKYSHEIDIPPDDIEHIIEIIKTFDEFERAYRGMKTAGEKQLHKFNSTLYVCKLRCIFTLAYFYKYSPICLDMPVKSAKTTNDIAKVWNMFIRSDQHRALMEPFMKPRSSDDDKKKIVGLEPMTQTE